MRPRNYRLCLVHSQTLSSCRQDTSLKRATGDIWLEDHSGWRAPNGGSLNLAGLDTTDPYLPKTLDGMRCALMEDAIHNRIHGISHLAADQRVGGASLDRLSNADQSTTITSASYIRSLFSKVKQPLTRRSCALRYEKECHTSTTLGF